MNRNFVAKHWYASVYEQFETQTYDVELLVKILDEHCCGEPQRILEAACGGGRILAPLAQAGHDVTGFDADEQMLLRCCRRMAGMPNARCYQCDGAASDWGHGYDVVVLAGNILINIESDMDYAQAQQTFLRNAAAALRTGGHLYLDFDLHFDPAAVFNQLGERSYFVGTDELGTSGRTVNCGGAYDPVTQLCADTGHTELTLSSGERMIIPRVRYKHIPTQSQVYTWLADAGLAIERTYRNFTEEPLPEPITEGTHRAAVWARKV